MAFRKRGANITSKIVRSQRTYLWVSRIVTTVISPIFDRKKQQQTIAKKMAQQSETVIPFVTGQYGITEDTPTQTQPDPFDNQATESESKGVPAAGWSRRRPYP